MYGFFVVVAFFILSFIIEKIMKIKPTIHFSDKSEYIPILTANIYADLFIIFLTFSGIFYKSATLTRWYKKYRLSAMMGDILIGVLYILLGRYVVSYFKLDVGLTEFAAICVGIQVIFDFLFYFFFSAVPYKSNDMLDFFKEYAKETKIDAIFGDSVLVIFAVILSALLNTQTVDFNIVALISSLYLVPYFIYMRD
jgi:hypothetical protein